MKINQEAYAQKSHIRKLTPGPKQVILPFMYITVRLLNGFQKPLLYKLEHGSSLHHTLIGSMVSVPLQKRFEAAIVIGASEHLRHSVSFEIRSVSPDTIKQIDDRYFRFISTLSSYYHTDIIHFAKRIQQFVTQKEHAVADTPEPKTSTKKETELTAEQATIYSQCTNAITNQTFYPALIHGVTGSGKTEIYKKLLVDCIQNNKTALFLVPEVTLALQFEQLLRSQLPDNITIISFHSATSTKQKKALWHHLVQHKSLVIIGVHLPILLPIANLGLIIVDEEHETGYQEKKHPKINTKEAALMRAQQYNIPIVLGSATPSVSTLHHVKTKGYAFFQLTKRFAGNFPTIRIAQLARETQKKRPHFWISQELYSALQDRLENNEQAIIYLNRRGHSFFVQCKQCTFIFECKDCSVSLTLHDNGKLTCHYCGYSQQEPTACPACKESNKHFLKKGIGTQQLVTILQNLFPNARIARADMDTSTKKKTWQETITQFSSGEIDILVGTQTITKGYHFPGVTLVGIVWADLNMHMPMFNAQETTLQQLIQVAGRAGRQSKNSLVVVQTMSKHALFDYLDERTYLQFYAQEIAHRKELGYPPCKRLISIELKHTHETRVEQESYSLIQQLRTLANIHQINVQLLGPAKPMIHKIKKTYTRTLYLKSVDVSACIRLFSLIDQSRYRSSIFFTPNPIN